MAAHALRVLGERPDEVPNPSDCHAFRERYPALFAPLQTEAFDHLRRGRSLALVGSTSSGKTLAASAPLFESRQKAVFVYPFRALLLDQRNQLLRYGEPFGLTPSDFAVVMGGSPDRELAAAVEKPYILMTPDKLVSLFVNGRTPKGAALAILSNYAFVFDEIHAYNSLMRASLIYFIRSVKYWRDGVGAPVRPFCFLSATFPETLWPVLQDELGMSDDDRVTGVSNAGEVTLLLRPSKDDPQEIAREMRDSGMLTNVVGVFNTAIGAWRVAEALWGRELARQRVFVGQDKMSERERVRNLIGFINSPSGNGLCGSPAIAAGVDFRAGNVVVQESAPDQLLQAFGRAARSGDSATVLCFSSRLFALQQAGQLKPVYSRAEFGELVRRVIPVSEPRTTLIGLAAYPYFRFWDGADIVSGDTLALCRELQSKGVDPLLVFRGLTPYTQYETGERIGFRALFKRDLRIVDGKVSGSPSLERYFFARKRQPILSRVRKIALTENVDEDTRVALASISFDGLGTHWVLLEFKSPRYERSHPHEEDDNIRLRWLNGGELGRISERGARNGIVRFWEMDV